MKHLITMIIIIFSSQSLSCSKILSPQIESFGKINFCEFKKMMISENCTNLGEGCALIKELNIKKEKIIKQLQDISYSASNPGASICKKYGWNILKGTLKDSSELCICSDQKGNLIICTSLIKLFSEYR